MLSLNMMPSREDSNHIRSGKYKETYCVEYDQDGVVSDLKEIIYEQMLKKKGGNVPRRR